MTNLIKILVLLFGLISSTFAQLNRTNLPIESVISLNGTWAFRTDPNDVGETERGWFNPAVSVANWDSLPVPGNWDLRNEYAHYVGKGWYRRTFASPANADGKVVRLLFEAVYHDCTVWLNGQKLGENHSGFLPFEFDVTRLLNANGPNTLVVCADNTLTRGAIWNWGGIRRPVTLVVSEPVRVVRQHITPTVNSDLKTATVAVRVFIQNHTGQATEANGTVNLSASRGPANRGPAKNGFNRSLPFRVSVPASGSASVLVQTTLTPQETHLWHFDDPFLYTSTVNLTPSGTPDRPLLGKERGPGGEVVRFGLRKIEVDNKTYTLKLNGESIRPMGFNLVPDDRTTGNTLPTWRIKEDIDLLKGLGCTMTRLSHLCLPDEVMDYLDERGILVFSEIPLWGYDRLVDPASATSKDWLSRLITNQYNHPSVIGWSVGNEYGEFPTAMAYTKQAVAYAKTLDSTRLVTCVSHTAQAPADVVDVGDFGLINKYSKNLGPITRQQHQYHPDKTLFYSEFGIGQLAENLDADIESKALIDSIRNLPYLIGASLWTFNDYRSRFYGTKETSENRPWGIVDVYRQKKRAYYSYRREMNPLRAMTVQPQGGTSAEVRLQPRNVLDLPAYPLHGYQLLWKRTDATGKITQGGLIPLPDIRPGDAPQTLPIRWQPGNGPTDNAFAMTVELLAPTGDVLADTTLFYQKPAPVAISYLVGGRVANNGLGQAGMIRVHFTKTPTATAYRVRYSEVGADANNSTLETPLTHNNYVDILRLPLGKTYQVSVFGVNGAGEGESAGNQRVTVEPLGFAPPAIQHIEPADGGFFLGYASPDDDFAYRVQVSAEPGNWTNARTVQSQTPGTLFVPNLTNGRPYTFRVQRIKDNAFISNWSEAHTVTPDGGQRPAVPLLQGVIRQGDRAVVCFEPVPKATGYVVAYKLVSAGNWTEERIITAQTGRHFMVGLDSHQSYQFRLATLNEAGQSDFSTDLTLLPDAKGRRN